VNTVVSVIALFLSSRTYNPNTLLPEATLRLVARQLALLPI